MLAWGLNQPSASRHIESVAHRNVWKTFAMSAAQVINTTMLSPTSRVQTTRGSTATSFQSVDNIDTNLAARGRDDFARGEELDDFDSSLPRRRRSEFQDQVVRFSGVLLSRDVGTTIVQAQAMATRQNAPTLSAGQAERNVEMYEFNQSLMGEPEVTTDNGLMH
jgi:hypothetical protein